MEHKESRVKTITMIALECVIMIALGETSVKHGVAKSRQICCDREVRDNSLKVSEYILQGHIMNLSKCTKNWFTR